MNKIHPERTALIQVARLNDMSEDWPKAMQNYQGLAELFPGDPFILEPLAKAQQKLGLSQDSLLTLLKAAEGYAARGLVRKAAQLRARLCEVPAGLEQPVAVLA